MSRVARCILNVPHEGPGLIGDLLRERGWRIAEIHAHAGEPIPGRLDAGELLVVMGGPMGVGDMDDPAYPWLRPTSGLLAQRLAAGEPSLGICLGSQLLAHAAGARVAPMRDSQGRPVREIGWMTVEAACDDPVFAGVGRTFTTLHWHGDASELPAGATLLASTRVCPVQMYRIGRSFGLQFHPEVDGADVALWTKEDGAYVEAANGPGAARELAAMSAEAAAASEPTRRRLLANVLSELGCG